MGVLGLLKIGQIFYNADYFYDLITFIHPVHEPGTLHARVLNMYL
jgi:acyl dehydratase